MSLIQKSFKRLHYPIDVIAQCVRWYLAYSLSLRELEEIMAERGIIVDHSTLHRWVIRLVPLLDKAFRRHKRRVGRRSGANGLAYLAGSQKRRYAVSDKKARRQQYIARPGVDRRRVSRFMVRNLWSLPFLQY